MTTGRNLMHFLSRADLNHLYAGRVQKFFQPGPVLGNWYADNDDAFRDITNNSSGQWHLLITDTGRVVTATAALEAFRANNPACMLAILNTDHLPSSPVDDAIMVEVPGDEDLWLVMMNGLLGQISTGS